MGGEGEKLGKEKEGSATKVSGEIDRERKKKKKRERKVCEEKEGEGGFKYQRTIPMLSAGEADAAGRHRAFFRCTFHSALATRIKTSSS